MKHTKRVHWTDKIAQRDRTIAAAFNGSAVAPLPACRCKRLTRATWIGGVRGDGQCTAVQVCHRCRGYQPLGPSDETPVAIEVRATRLAQEDGWQEANAAEVHGWNDRLDEMIVDSEGGTWTAAPRDGDDEEDWHAGYFAHAIASHDDEQEEAAARAVAREVRDSIEPSGVRLRGQP